jgi:hypothetical protein
MKKLKTDSQGLREYQQAQGQFISALPELAMQLNGYEVKQVIIDFSGSGDDGQLTDAYLVYSEGIFDPETSIYSPLNVGHGGYQTRLEKVTNCGRLTIERNTINPLHPSQVELLRGLTYAVIEASHYDWVNNEGGFGRVIYNMLTGQVNLEISLNVMTTEDHSFVVGHLSSYESTRADRNSPDYIVELHELSAEDL